MLVVSALRWLRQEDGNSKGSLNPKFKWNDGRKPQGLQSHLSHLPGVAVGTGGRDSQGHQSSLGTQDHKHDHMQATETGLERPALQTPLSPASDFENSENVNFHCLIQACGLSWLPPKTNAVTYNYGLRDREPWHLRHQEKVDVGCLRHRLSRSLSLSLSLMRWWQ